MNNTNTKLKIAAMSDIHVSEISHGDLQLFFNDIALKADILILCGDLTDHGLPVEARVLVNELQICPIPKVAVLGNHDHESGRQDEVKKILRDSNIIMLEDEVFIFENIGFAGTKGFVGGYGEYMLTAFGEQEIKNFVNTSLEEVKRLEINLSKLQNCQKKIAAFHYSPIPQTLQGEPLEIYPFLGNSRLEEVIDRFHVSFAFHGHAHNGSLEGKTAKGAIVYNVALPLLQKYFPKVPYRIIEI